MNEKIMKKEFAFYITRFAHTLYGKGVLWSFQGMRKEIWRVQKVKSNNILGGQISYLIAIVVLG
jgi:hypothetical protein